MGTSGEGVVISSVKEKLIYTAETYYEYLSARGRHWHQIIQYGNWSDVPFKGNIFNGVVGVLRPIRVEVDPSLPPLPVMYSIRVVIIGLSVDG